MATVKREGNIVYLQTADKMRKIGEIYGGVTAGGADKAQMTDTAVLVVERDKRKHLMEVWQAYGFSKEVMDHKDWFDMVQIDETDGGRVNTYIIPREDIVMHGREYQSNDFERQYFVPVAKLQPYKI